MLLMVFWGSLGLILGARGPLLGAIFVFLPASGGTLNSQKSSCADAKSRFFLGAQNRHQEVPKEDDKRHQKKEKRK